MKMVPKIWLKLPGEKAYQAKPDAIRFGNDVYIRLEGNGQDVKFGGSPKVLVPFLEGLLQAIRSQSDHDELAPPPATEGSVEEPEEPIEELPPADPDERPKTTAFDLKDKAPEEQLGLMIEYFHAAPSHLRNQELITELQRRYKAIIGKPYKPRKRDEIDRVVEVLRPHYRRLVKADGKPAWGAKKEVARLAGYPQSGGVFGERIDKAFDRLAEEQRKQAA